VHRLLAGASPDARIIVNGRAGPFVDIAASVNRLLDRTVEAATANTAFKDHFEILANTVPEVALVHTSTILYANEAAGALFGIGPDALRGKQMTDLMRPAYRAMMRKHVSSGLEGDTAIEPIEVQLINGDDDGLWVELFSRRINYLGQGALISVARDITHRKSLEASLGRGKLQARVTLESIG
jgi:PAS domain S-box-containing protein